MKFKPRVQSFRPQPIRRVSNGNQGQLLKISDDYQRVSHAVQQHSASAKRPSVMVHDPGLIEERPLNVRHSVQYSGQNIDHLLHDSLGSDNPYEKEMKLVKTRRFDIQSSIPNPPKLADILYKNIEGKKYNSILPIIPQNRNTQSQKRLAPLQTSPTKTARASLFLQRRGHSESIEQANPILSGNTQRFQQRNASLNIDSPFKTYNDAKNQ